MSTLPATIFDTRDYKHYLHARDQTAPRGSRKRLAEAAGCKPAYVTQILNSNAHFSLEQAQKLNRFLAHSPEEASYFLVLVQLARAGTPDLRAHFDAEVDRALESRLDLRDRIGFEQPLNLEDQVNYYSSWHFAAIHVAVTIDGLSTSPKISQRLGLEPELVAQALEFLAGCGLVEARAGRYHPGRARIHLDNRNRLALTHHAQWRLKAIQNLEKRAKSDLHFSSIITLSREDAEKIREILARQVESVMEKVGPSPAEDIYAFNVDFFRVG